VCNKRVQGELVRLEFLQLVKVSVCSVVDQLLRARFLVFHQGTSCFYVVIRMIHLELGGVFDSSYGLEEELASVNSVVLVFDIDHLGLRLSNTHERSSYD